MKRRFAALFGLLFLVPASFETADAAELRSATLEKRDGTYIAKSEMWLDADVERVYGVLSNWDISTRFSDLIIASHNVEKDAAGRPGFYMQNMGCVLFFCRTVEREGYVELEPNKLIRAVSTPEKSDFEVSDERWYFSADGGGTKIRYEMDLKPKFWIPPIIGPYTIKRKLRKHGLEALQRVEDYLRAGIESVE